MADQEKIPTRFHVAPARGGFNLECKRNDCGWSVQYDGSGAHLTEIVAVATEHMEEHDG